MLYQDTILVIIIISECAYYIEEQMVPISSWNPQEL